jgi:hypothetical protein
MTCGQRAGRKRTITGVEHCYVVGSVWRRRAPAISRSTVSIIAVAAVVILVGLGLLGRVISEHHQANSLYATPSTPLAVADANASAEKATAAAQRAQLAADRAKASAASKAAQP